MSHLEDFEVVLRLFYKLSDCKVHSLSVAGRNARKNMLAAVRSPDLQCGGRRRSVSSQEAEFSHKQPGTFHSSHNFNL